MSQEIDYEKALLCPASVFAQPEDILSEAGLTLQQKIEILRRWEYDESELSVAVEEGMRGGESTLLRRILIALEQLPGGSGTEHTDPTKQHGLTSTNMTRRDSKR
jgi:hypothetical protein